MDTPKNLTESGAQMGRQQALALIASKCSAAQAQVLKEIKESRAYEDFGLTWPEFCQTHVGLCRERVDALIRRFDEFGEAYFRLSRIAHISPETYRQLEPKVEEDTVSIDGEQIELTLPNAVRIRAAIRKLRAERDRARRAADLREPLGIVALRQSQDALIEEAKRISFHFHPNADRKELVDLATYSIGKWKKFAREFAETAIA